MNTYREMMDTIRKYGLNSIPPQQVLLVHTIEDFKAACEVEGLSALLGWQDASEYMVASWHGIPVYEHPLIPPGKYLLTDRDFLLKPSFMGRKPQIFTMKENGND